MNRYLQQIAARGAGAQAGRVAPAVPSRFAYRYGDLPTLLAQPGFAAPGSIAPFSEPLMSELPMSEQPLARPGAPQSAATPPPAAGRGLPTGGDPLLEMEPLRKRRARVNTESSAPASAAPGLAQGAARVEMLPASRDQAEMDGVAGAAAAIQPQAHASAGAASHTPVRLEPARRPSIDADLAALLPEAGRPIYDTPGMGAAMGVRLPPVRERLAAFEAAAPANEVRVSIGRIDVRIDAERASAAASRPRAEPDDPFGALALARRGWRTF